MDDPGDDIDWDAEYERSKKAPDLAPAARRVGGVKADPRFRKAVIVNVSRELKRLGIRAHDYQQFDRVIIVLSKDVAAKLFPDGMDLSVPLQMFGYRVFVDADMPEHSMEVKVL